jgi:transcriptional regulator with XRE-family HTH domain
MADLKAFRKANKLTQEQVADYLGIKKPFICKIETGRESFPEKHLRKLLGNPHGWDITHLAEVSETSAETSNTPDTTEQPTEDVVVISTQVLEEMSAQRQLTEQALALVQEQLEAKQETIEAVREQLATTQEQLTTSQEHLTTSQEQLSTSQEQLSAEQQQTNNALASLAKSIERIDKAQAQMDELILMLKKEQARQDHHLAQLEAEHKQSQQSQKPTQPQLSKSKTDN